MVYYAMVYFLLMLVSLLFILYSYLTRFQNYWRDRGIPYVKLSLIPSVFRSETQFPEEEYLQFVNHFSKERYIGAFQRNRPVLLVFDSDLSRQICIKCSDSFENHIPDVPKIVDPYWNKILYCSEVEKDSRELKALFGPLYSTSNLKQSLDVMQICAKQFTEYYRKNDCTIEVKDAFTKLAVDLVSGITFDTPCNSHKTPTKNEFYSLMREITDFSGLKHNKYHEFEFIPHIMKIFGFRFISDGAAKSLGKLLDDVIKSRKLNPTNRFDLTQLLMDNLEEFDTNYEKNDSKDYNPAKRVKLSKDRAVAIIIEYAVAMVGNAPNILTCIIYELALNPDVQEKLFKEIQAAPRNSDGKLSYEALVNIKYLDMVVSEGMRKWPDVWYVERLCTKPFLIQPEREHEKPLLIEKGTGCVLNVLSIHRNPQIYENPTKFNPERFNDENIDKIKPYYIPFGLGPRGCPAWRFALLVMKTMLEEVVTNFQVFPVEKTPIPLRLKGTNFNHSADDVFLGFRLRRIAE